MKTLSQDFQLRNVLAQLKDVRKSGNGWIARCPAHDDQHASLSIRETSDGKILLYCHACRAPFETIIAALPHINGNSNKSIITTYDYLDEQGEVVLQVCRTEPKGFFQRRPDNHGGFINRVDGVRRVLYRLPELRAADHSLTVFITEGEKDADRLAALGLIATTNSGGAGKWRAESNQLLRGRKVVVLPDNDGPGRKHGQEVANSLHGIAANIKIVDLPGLPPKGDVSDWLDGGGTMLTLRELAAATPEFHPPPSTKAESASAPLFLSYREFMSQTATDEEVIALEARRGELALVQSVTNRGKSTLMLNAALCLAAGRTFLTLVPTPIPRRVIYMQFEGSRGRFQSDLRTMHRMLDEQEKESVERNLTPAHAPELDDEPLTLTVPRHLEILELEARALTPDVIVIDTASAAFSIRKENDNSEITDLMKSLIRLARRLNCVIVVIHHIGKASIEDGQTKEAAHRGRGASSWADNAASIFNLECNPTTPDLVTLTCAKRKTGTGENYETRIKLDRNARWFDPTNDSPPRTRTHREMVLDVLKDAPLPTNGIEQLLAGKMSERTVRSCLKELVAGGLATQPKRGFWQRHNPTLGNSATPLKGSPNYLTLQGRENTGTSGDKLEMLSEGVCLTDSVANDGESDTAIDKRDPEVLLVEFEV